jgi:protein O-mannosyl-transferase
LIHETVTDMMGWRRRYRGALVGLLLVALAAALYWPVAGYDFITLDDNLYILENRNVQQGFTGKNLIWAMTTFDAANWHPLTWLSLLADYELFGLHAAGYHTMNLFLHLLNTLFLFLLLKRITGETWKGAIVAAVFAVHPLNIESVVWIAERKNLLSTLFWLLTMMAYVRYTEKPGWKRYSLVLLSFILGLTAKPMLVTLPFVLLLLDYWPLRRFSRSVPNRPEPLPVRAYRQKTPMRLLAEKAPLFLLALLSAGVTLQAARTGGAVKAISLFPMIDRIENAILSYVLYLYKMVWPMDLAIFYPRTIGIPLWQVGLSVLFLAAVTAIVCIKGRKHRYLITGWLWYGITLLPVIGVVQVGFQSMANRYAYIPLIGIGIIVAWGLPDILMRYSAGRYLPHAAVVVILALTFATKAALPHWKDSEAVFHQALEVTRNNHIAELGMGNLWFDRGDLPRARSHYLESLRIKPDYAEGHNNLAMVLMREGRSEEAAVHYREAIKAEPTFEKAHNNLGVLLAGEGKLAEAKACFLRALELKPDHAEARANLAGLLKEEGTGEAVPPGR